MHQVLLRILECIHEYCMANNIRYSLGGGTLLGAIRHKGFIPWDDDADIMMPRPDYERFQQGFPGQYPHDRLQHWRNDKDYPHLFAKVYDDRIRLEGAKHRKGLFVDVFPIDGLPPVSEQKMYWDRYNKCRLFEYIQGCSLRSMFRKLIIFAVVTYPIWRFIPADKFRASTEKFLLKYPFETSAYAGCTVGMYGMAEFMEVDTFRHYIDVPFQGLQLRAIATYHPYLTQHYGDYMKIPPEEKGNFQHNLTYWWKEE